MDREEVINEFATFLKEVEKLGIKIEGSPRPDDLQLLDFPPFYVPNWPIQITTERISLGLRRPWYLEKNSEKEPFSLKRRLVAMDIEICEPNGNISIYCAHPLDMESRIEFKSSDINSVMRLNCFIIFFQYLDPILKKLMRAIKINMEAHSINSKEISRSIEIVKESFESLVPFLVADKLKDD